MRFRGKTVPSRAPSLIAARMSDDGETLKAALAAIDDPLRGGDLVSAGRVTMARVKEGVVTVVLDATGLSAEQRANLERRIRAATIA